MSSIKAKGELVNGLIETVTIGLQRDRMAEAEAILAAVRVLRPGLAVLDTFDAWLALKKGRFTDAALLLRNLDFGQAVPAIGKALRACCLFAVGDADWRVSANEVLAEDADPDAVALVRLLIGQPAVQNSATAPPTDATGSENVSDTGLSHELTHSSFMRV